MTLDSNLNHGIFFGEGRQKEYTGTGYIKIERLCTKQYVYHSMRLNSPESKGSIWYLLRPGNVEHYSPDGELLL